MPEIDCVMLAAGSSTRMDAWKMTLPFEGSTIVERSTRTALVVSSRVILVTGFRSRELSSLFSGWGKVEVLENPRYREGMFSSIQCGAKAVHSGRFFLALADMPGVSAETYRTLLSWADCFFPEAGAVIPKFRGKKGHPLLLSRETRERISGFDSSKTLRDVLAEVASVLVPVEDRFILQDIDTPADYRAAGTERSAGGSG